MKLSPLNLRPRSASTRHWNAKAIALVASGYARLAAAHGDDAAREQAERWLGWLVEHQQRPTRARRGATTSTSRRGSSPTARGHAEHDRHELRRPGASSTACELLGETERAGGRARDAAEFLVARHARRRAAVAVLPLPAAASGSSSTTPTCSPASVLARAARLAGDDDLLDAARAAVATVDARRPAARRLLAVRRGRRATAGSTTSTPATCSRRSRHAREPSPGAAAAARARASTSGSASCSCADGTPKYFAERRLPVDAHCYAQAIDTWLAWLALAPGRARARANAWRALLVERMLDPTGYVALPAPPAVDEPRAVRPLDDRAGVPRARAARARRRNGIGERDARLGRPRELAARAALRAGRRARCEDGRHEVVAHGARPRSDAAARRARTGPAVDGRSAAQSPPGRLGKGARDRCRSGGRCGRFARRRQPDVALSHGSYAQIVAARARRGSRR